MTILTVDEIVQVTGGKVLCGKAQAFEGLSIDSRNIKSGELFVALKGERFDGHDFVPDAIRQCSGALVSRQPEALSAEKTIIFVEDTLRALQDIAGFRRSKRNVPVIAVTGTNGKTTTKEMIASILSCRNKVLRTSGNFNNHIGLPLCVANMHGDEAFMVLEMGSNARGDISRLCDIVDPDIAVVTNVGQAHLEGFGSIEAVRDTDLEVLSYVKTVCLNADDLFLMQGIGDYKGKIITYGIENRADYTVKDLNPGSAGSGFVICTPDRAEMQIKLKVSGRSNVINALAAASAACELGISPEDIRAGLENFRGVPMRLEVREYSGAIFINDVYNANPASMESALQELARLRKGRAVAVLGDMLELGKYSAQAHKELVEKLNLMKMDVLIAAGPEMNKVAEGFAGSRYKAESSEAARALLLGMLQPGDIVLIKGSRGMRMEKVLGEDGAAMKYEGKDAV